MIFEWSIPLETHRATTAEPQAKYGGRYVKKVESWDVILENVGVESRLRAISEYDDTSTDTINNHATDFVFAKGVRHSWFRNISVSNFAENAASFGKKSYHMSVIDMEFLDPVGTLDDYTHGFAYQVRGHCHLFMNCMARGAARFVVTASEARGPIAFVNCTSYEGTGEAVRSSTSLFIARSFISPHTAMRQCRSLTNSL